MSILYPHLPFNLAVLLAQERCSLNLEEAIGLSEDLHLSKVFYSPTGGNRVTEFQLRELQRQVRECAKTFGYPQAGSEKQLAAFDSECTALIFDKMDLIASEASDLRMWYYLTCVLLPDVVRWRFPGENDGETSTPRFLGSDRGLRRNTIGRLWWRAFVLHIPNEIEKYRLIRGLNEDELVQITERPSLAADPILSREVATALLALSFDDIVVSRRELFRDVAKRFRRLFPLIRFQSLETEEIRLMVDFVFNQSIHAFNDV